MATLSAISKFLACYTWDRKGEGQEWGSGITSWDNTALSFFVPILIWNGVNSQSKSNKLQYKNKNSILRKGTLKQNATVEILILKKKTMIITSNKKRK